MTKKILMVEDSPSVRQLMSFTLRGAGYEVIEAHDGLQALEIFNTDAVDMVITDCNMPKMDGLTLTKRLRSSPNNRFMPIIMLTAIEDEAVRTEARQAGASGWINKPFKPDQLLNVVQMVIN